MNLGAYELVLVVVVTMAVAIVIRKPGNGWMGVMPFICLTTALLTPPDIASTLMIAVPNVGLLVIAVRLAQNVPGKPAASD